MTTHEPIVLEEIKTDKKRFLSLLLLADEQEDMIDRYLERGALYALVEDGKAKAVCVVTHEGDGVYEVKNMAVAEAFQRMGLGRAVMDEIARLYARRARILRVGTGAGTSTEHFYERCGYRRVGTIQDFFKAHYDHPIVEDGVTLCDMAIFERTL